MPAVLALLFIAITSLYLIERERLKASRVELSQAQSERDSLYDLSIRQVEKIHSFNELSEKHAKELSNAQKEIDRLSDSIRTGKQRVYVKADCPTVSGADKAGSVGDAGTARLSDTAREDYLRLRRMMADNLQQTRYLQDYIRTQCLSVK
jgi:prophage endopeptidase